MGIFDFIKNKLLGTKQKIETVNRHEEFNDLVEHRDYLESAAEKKCEALNLIKEKRFDDAWRVLHQKKQLLMLHSNQYGCTKQQAIAIDGAVHEHLANILRLEGRHDEALIHCVYWIKSSADHHITTSQLKKLPAYLNRSSVNKDAHQSITDYATNPNDGLADISSIKSKLSELFNHKA